MSESARFVHDIPVRPRDPARPRTSARACAIRGCAGAGEYRAPVSPTRIEDYQWLCLDHVRAHNTSWDFFRGMSADDVERYIRDNLTGHRPTWTLGDKTARLRGAGGMGAAAANASFNDSFSVFEGTSPGFAHQRPTEPGRHLTRLQRDALDVLDLGEAACLNDVKARYKELVKRYHPDANGGDRSCEDRLKRVIRAYRTLKASNFR